MKKNNNSLLIFSGYHLPHLGGIERYTDNLANAFINLGWDVTIVSSNYDNLNNKEIINDIINYRIPIYNIFKSRYPIPKKNKEFKNIFNEIDKEKYDAIIVNTRFHLTSLIGAKYGKKNSIPVFLIEHGSQHLTVDNKVLDYFGSIYEHILTSYIKKFINYYYGVSKEACNWQKHFKIDSNGVWYNSIKNFREDYKIKKEKNKINILYAGRILRQKGIIELVNSFNKLCNEYDNIYLHIAGDGNLLDSLKTENKNRKITFYGKLNFKDLCDLYSKTDIFVYAPNWPEGLPTGILEAGLMECAVISSPQGGNKEIIENNKTGLMINNEEQLEKALKYLFENPKVRKELCNNLKEKILNNFEWTKTSKKIINDLKKGVKEYEK